MKGIMQTSDQSLFIPTMKIESARLQEAECKATYPSELI